MRAVLILVFGMAAITVNDTLFKLFSDTYSLHQLVFMRSCGSLLILLPIFFMRIGDQTYKSNRVGLHTIRSLMLVCGNMIYFSGLAVLPIGEATALVFIYPMLITLMAYLFLNEQIGIIRWLALAFGFVGTILVVQPFSAEFRLAYLIPLSSAIFYATFSILTKVLGKTEPTETLVFYSVSGFLVTSALVGIVFGSGFASPDDGGAMSFMLRAWQWPVWPEIPSLLSICCSAAIISFCLSAAYRMGEASLLAPFEYVALPMSLVSGFLIWGDFPNLIALCGMTMIMLTGIVVAIRELVRNRTPASSPQGLVGQALDEDALDEDVLETS